MRSEAKLFVGSTLLHKTSFSRVSLDCIKPLAMCTEMEGHDACRGVSNYATVYKIDWSLFILSSFYFFFLTTSILILCCVMHAFLRNSWYAFVKKTIRDLLADAGTNVSCHECRNKLTYALLKYGIRLVMGSQ